MSLPASWTLITVTATYLNRDGTPASGNVAFTSEQIVVIDDITVVPKKIVAILDATGSIEVELPSTDDPDLNVTGWAYTVHENIRGGRDDYAIFVEYNGGPINLADVSPVVDPGELTGLATSIQLAALDARVVILEDAPGGGVTDHGALTGLADDDHPQYYNAARGAAAFDALGAAAAAQAAAAIDATTKANTAQTNAQTYADGLVVGLIDDRGNYDASTNLFPATGGSGSAGAVVKGDLWTVSVAGTLGGSAVTAGDLVRALVNTPGQTAANWAITENNIGYVAENSSNKDTDGTFAANSDTKYPSQKAVKTYADTKAALSHTHAPADITQAGATSGQALVWNGSAWAPATVSASPGGSTTELQYNNAGAFAGVPGATFSSNTLRIVSQAAASIPLAIQAATSQTGNLTEWRDSVGSILGRVHSTGKITTPGIICGNGTITTNAPAFSQSGDPGQGLNIIDTGVTYQGSGSTNQLWRITSAAHWLLSGAGFTWSTSATSVFTSADAGWHKKVAGVLEANNGTKGSYAGSAFGAGSQTVAQLPGASTCEGARSMVTDSTQTLTAGIGATVAGGGANKVPVVSNGTNWLIG